MILRRAALALLAASALAGCATALRDAPPAELSGRLSLRVEAHEGAPARSLSSQFELRGDAWRGSLQLNSPLGTTLAQARWAPDGAELVSGEGTQRFADLDSLTRELFGESLPMAALLDWLRGRPWRDAASQRSDNPAGFEQLGWRIDLARFDEGWVVATRDRAPAVAVRARLEKPQ